MPPPRGNPDAPLQLLVANLDSSDYVGRIAIGRIFNGRVKIGDQVAVCKLDAAVQETKVTKLYAFDGLKRIDIEQAAAGDIVCLAGIEDITIGETIADVEHRIAIPPIAIDEPTVSMVFGVNTSPMAGREGQYVTSRQLRDRLDRELLGNVSIRLEPTDSPEQVKIVGRGELQLSILIEMMRREGFELQVSRPDIVTKTVGGQIVEPVEELVIDVPEDHQGVVIAQVGERKGVMTKMVQQRQRPRCGLEFRIPARGLIGFRSQFMTDTKGTGIMNHIFSSWEPWHGAIPSRATGALVADRPGPATAYAIYNLQERGEIFIDPGIQVYEGMVIGENSRPNDMDVNVTKEKKQTNMRASTADEAIRLIPPRKLGLEQAIEFINDDELVEVTPVEHPAPQADARGEHAAESKVHEELTGLTSVVQPQDRGLRRLSVLRIAGRRSRREVLLVRPRQSGDVGLRARDSRPRPRHGLRAAGDGRVDPALRAGALRLGREHPRRGRAEHPVAEHVGAALVRRERRGAGLLPGRLVDGAQRVLAARRPAAHLFQHDVGARSRAERRRNHRPGPDDDYLHRLGRDGVPLELGDGRVRPAPAAARRRPVDGRCLGVGVRADRGADALRPGERQPV